MIAYMKVFIALSSGLGLLLVTYYGEPLWKLNSKKANSVSEIVNQEDKVMERYIGGYYWSGALKVTKPEDLNPNLLTHLYYAFLNVNDDGSFTIQQEDKGYVEGLANLKAINPDLKVLFSVVNQNGSFSKVVADENLRKKFIQNAYDLMKKYNYDGMDFDWEFPEDKDKENFVSLLKEIYAEFKKHGYLVTAAVRSMPIYKNTGYIVPEISKYLDIINIMTYDFYGAWSNTTGQNSPLYPSSLDSDYEKKYLNIESSIKNWVDAGAPKEKLALGLPFYGRTFTLKDPENHSLHAPSSGGGTPLAPTYYQILKNYGNYTTAWNEEQFSPYKYSGTTWLAYEDEQSIEIKVKYGIKHNLKGTFVWHLGCDDVYGELSEKKQVLLQRINDAQST